MARDSRWFRVLFFGVAAAIWVLPGPIVGIALANAIQFIIKLPDGPWTWLLYRHPSPVPIIWAQGLRAFDEAFEQGEDEHQKDHQTNRDGNPQAAVAVDKLQPHGVFRGRLYR